MVNYYEILRLDPTLSNEEIQKELNILQRKWTNRLNIPNNNLRQEAQQMIEIIQKAKETLLDDARNKVYEDSLYPKDQHTVKEYEEKINAFIENGQLYQAENILKTISEKWQSDSKIFYLWGLLYHNQQKYKKACDCLKQSLEYNKKDSSAWYLLGECLKMMGNRAEALKAMEKAVEISPNNISIVIALGNLKIQDNSLEDALNIAERAIKSGDRSYEVLRLISKCYIQSQVSPHKIIEILKEAQSKGNDRELDGDIAQFMYLSEDYEGCIKYCKKILMLYPNSNAADKAKTLIYEIKKKKVSRIQSEQSKRINKVNNKEDNSKNNALIEALDKLGALVGLESVKKEIQRMVKLITFEQERRLRLDLPYDSNDPIGGYHFLFIGNPGTGKTTVARLIGDIFYNLGLLEKGHLLEVDRSALVGQYIGQTAVLTQKAIKKAMGGILFVDEAYALARSESGNDYGREAIETLLKAMEDYKGKFTVIMAGYTNEMRHMLNINPGLASRINVQIHFPNYNKQELLSIARIFAHKDHYKLNEEAQRAFERRINKENIDDHFANARVVRNVIEEAIREKAFRMSGKELTKKELTTLEPIDFGIIDIYDNRDLLEEASRELDKMIGLEEVKEKVVQIKDYIEMQMKRKEAGFKTTPLVLHMQFSGNPGTGKTSVARVITKIFQGMGILQKGHLVEVSRVDLIGTHVGQTAPKTLDKIKEAYGGILFIDEAYSLAQGGINDFGREAISTLIKEMEDSKEKFMVILTGYPQLMEGLFSMNPGLKERIRFHISFPDYTPDELVMIFKSMCEGNDYVLNEEAQNNIYIYILINYTKRGMSTSLMQD